MTNKFHKVFPGKKSLIGMIHLPLLPGYKGYRGEKYVISKSLKDLKTLELTGFDGVLIENHEGVPGFTKASDKTKDIFKKVVSEILSKTKLPVGMEIIYDMEATTKIACETGCQFVRLDVFVDSVTTRWGTIIHSYKKVNKILSGYKTTPLLLVDIHVKHAQLLIPSSLEKSISDSLKYGADGIIITGSKTGIEPNINDLKVANHFNAPVIIGSGLNSQNIQKLSTYFDAAIVGTSIKTGKYIDINKASQLVNQITN